MNGHSVDGCCGYGFLLTSVIKNLYSSVQIIFKETIAQKNARASHPILTSTTHFSKAKVDIYLHSSKVFNRLEMQQPCIDQLGEKLTCISLLIVVLYMYVLCMYYFKIHKYIRIKETNYIEISSVCRKDIFVVWVFNEYIKQQDAATYLIILIIS